MLDLRNYVVIEQALTSRLLKTWKGLASEIYKDLKPLLKDRDFKGAYELSQKIDLSPIVETNKNYIQYTLLHAGVFGARSVHKKNTSILEVGVYESFLKKIVENFSKIIEYNVTKSVRDSLLHSIAQVEQNESVVKGEKDTYLKDFVSFSRAGISGVKLTSSLHSSRMAVWGFSVEAEIYGLTEYRITAVLDGRTSAFCEAINGKTFQVSEAKESIHRILKVNNPDDAKILQPWPSQSKDAIERYKSLSSDELTKEGLHIPPYHPLCRTLCEKIGETTTIVTRPLQSIGERSTVTIDDFSVLGIKIPKGHVDHWNSSLKISPTIWLSKIIGVQPSELLERLGGKGSIEVRDNGDIRILAKAKIGENAVNINQVYDPITNTLHQNFVELKKTPAKDAVKFIQDLYKANVSLAALTGITSINTYVSGGGVALHAQMGFLPATEVWKTISSNLLKELSSTGKYRNIYNSLSLKQLQVVVDLLNSKNEKSIWVLMSLPFIVAGVKVGKLLLEDVGYQAKLDLTDKQAMLLFNESL